MAYQPNPGHLPDECCPSEEGRAVRVHLVLQDGTETRIKSPQGWDAATTNWKISRPPKWWDVKLYEVI